MKKICTSCGTEFVARQRYHSLCWNCYRASVQVKKPIETFEAIIVPADNWLKALIEGEGQVVLVEVKQ